MSNHSDMPLEGLEQLRQLMESEKEQFGATGKTPEPLLGPNDAGEIRFGVANYGGKVMLNFGEPIAWVGMGPEQAVELANILLKNAREANRIIGKKAKPLVVTL